MRKLLYYSGLFCITTMLFILHSAFAYSILPIFLAEKFFKNLFMWNGIDLKITFSYIFGAAFAFAISSIMALLKKTDKRFWRFAISVAIMELIGITLLVYPHHGNIWRAFSGIYYGFYLLLAIIFYFYIKPESDNLQMNAKDLHLQKDANAMRMQKEKNGKNDATVMQMFKDGLFPNEISEHLHINKSTVYRIIKKYENEH